MAAAFCAATILALIAAPNASAAWNGGDVYNGPQSYASQNRVILTYDDCPDNLRSYRNVLRWAKRHNVGLTIAPTGDCRAEYLESHGVNIAIMARNYGQYVISHSKSHPDLTTLSNWQIRNQLAAPRSSVASRYVRPPYGSYNQRVLWVMETMYVPKRMWLWSVDTRDWTGKSKRQVVNYTVRNTRPGDTVLMHMQWNGFSVPALREMVNGLNNRGIGVCRAYRGWDYRGPVESTPVWFWRQPC